MSLLSWFRKTPRETPVAAFDDQALGRLTWAPDDDGWMGISNGVEFVISAGQSSTPAADLLAYARRIVGDSTWLTTRLADAKLVAIKEFGPFYEEEIEGLTYGCVQFFDRKGVLSIIADLNGGLRERSWRIEFSNDACDGIGFDT